MARLPWTDPRAAGRPDEGGMEHLETDVMRFMAILAFCLVAIFALVQSVPEPPREPRPVPARQVVETPAAASAVPHTDVPKPRKVMAAEPQPESPAVAEPAQVAVAAPVPDTPAVPEAVTAEPPAPDTEVADLPPPVPATPTPQEPEVPEETPRGFSLRFDSDAALVGLVERDEVDLYAFARDRVWQFMIVDGRPTFRSAQAPGQIHEMAPDTVPHQVVTALRQSAVVPAGGVKWGVTLPAPTAAVLARVLATSKGGDLVIDADGFLHLEERT